MTKIPEELKHVKRVLQETEGLPSDNNHDPSNIIFYNGRYYLWYTQHRNDRPYDHFADCKICCAVSEDGKHWKNAGDALLPSKEGWDCAGVLTANVMAHNGKFYLFYTGVGEAFAEGKTKKRCCGLAAADTPDGEFVRISREPVFQWDVPGKWDDQAVDDISVLFWKGKWRIYYKGNSELEQDADKTMLGVAVSDRMEGPYERYEGNPLIRGHAFAIWPYQSGLCLLSGLKHDIGKIYGEDWHDPTGVQYLYYSEDGIHFEPCCEFANRAAGIYVPTDEQERKDIANYWGVGVDTLDTHKKRYLYRFGFDKLN